MLALIAVLTSAQFEEPDFYDQTQWTEAQYIVERALEPYRNHVEGDKVFEYYVCYRLQQIGGHLLFYSVESQFVILSPHQIWDIEYVEMSDFRANPTETFEAIYHVHWVTALWDEYGRIGRQGCLDLLSEHAMTWDDYNAFLDARREGN